MKQFSSSEDDEQDQEVIKRLHDLGSFEPEYPPELFADTRAAFVAKVERLRIVDVGEGLAPGDQEIIKLLANLKSAKAEYPPDLLAARRSAFLQQVEKVGSISLLDKLRIFIQRIFQPKTTTSTTRLAPLMRISLVAAGLIVTVLMGSLLFSRAEQSFKLSPSQGVAKPTRFLPTSTHEVAILICKPNDQASLCSPRELNRSQDLADQGNGVAKPAVAKDARSSYGGFHKAVYVNDGRRGESWVSNSPDSWIKIDLGKSTTINSVSFQKGSLGSSNDNNPGQFVIAVALSDVYADGNSSNDYTEYAQVFNSEQTSFSGTVAHVETVRTLFPPVKARFVKITFEKAGAAIEEVGVFMVQPPAEAEQATKPAQEGVPEISATLVPTNTLLPLDSQTSLPSDTQLPTETPSPIATDTGLPTDTAIPILTDTPHPSDMPIPLPTNTLAPADTATPVPTESWPLDTPIPSSTVVPPTTIPPTAQAPSESTGPIIIAGSHQTLTFTCNGNAVAVRGHANIVTLLGSCSSITVTGNGNRVFWQSGSPVITNKGNENIISQM